MFESMLKIAHDPKEYTKDIQTGDLDTVLMKEGMDIKGNSIAIELNEEVECSVCFGYVLSTGE